jgi:heme/copper-type cytochrome/quinol oxidase subunit 2
MENINTIMSTVIMVSFIVTIVLAIGSYWAYKLRERRKPKGVRAADEAPVFFERIYPAQSHPASAARAVEDNDGRAA